MEYFKKTGFILRISPDDKNPNFLKIECKTTSGNFIVLMPKKMGQMVEEKKLYIFHVNEDNYVVDIEEIMQFKKVFTATIEKTIKTNATQVLIFKNSSKKTQVVIADKEFDFNPYLGKKAKIVIDKKFGNIVHFKSISIINDNINSTKTSQQELNIDLMKNSNVSLSMTSTSYYLTLNGDVPQYIAKFDGCTLTYNGLEFKSANKTFFFPFFSNMRCLCEFSWEKPYFVSYNTINGIDTIIDLIPVDSSFDNKVKELTNTL